MINSEPGNGLNVSMPIHLPEVNKVSMSTHKNNATGSKAVLDGSNSFFVGKPTGQSTPIKHEHGIYAFDIWAPAPIKTNAKRDNDNNMEVDQSVNIFYSINNSTQCWVLGADDADEGF